MTNLESLALLVADLYRQVSGLQQAAQDRDARIAELEALCGPVDAPEPEAV